MSYTKNTWATGDTITAAKLNNMEDGIEAAGYDAVIRIERIVEGAPAESNLNQEASINGETAVVEFGSYSDVLTKLQNGQNPKVAIISSFETYDEPISYFLPVQYMRKELANIELGFLSPYWYNLGLCLRQILWPSTAGDSWTIASSETRVFVVQQ